ncbi:sulfate ABC transporter substrate-binding protein [Cohnella thermotolerans]|uniref:sulfate ABC transporter substrate-binding protein n=1 Tax=Cohnella thermotolerans TaxID=329858 RepID=UPI0004131617|nr:sulfate ABC transporter substrate-binding protein [Cohnella thermotolerans]
MYPDNRQQVKRWRTGRTGWLLGWLTLAVFVAGCGANGNAAAPGGASASASAAGSGGSVTLVIGAYSVAKDALQEILPAFRAEWKAKTGQDVKFQESYEASGTQARAIAGGFEADVAVLSMEGDIDKVKQAGLIRGDWKAGDDGGMVTRSIVVMGTRPGNPLGIREFDDLAKPGVKVLYPNPQTSGGAQWDINAIYGAGLKEAEEREGKKDEAAAKAFLASVHRNVESMDKSGRASMAAFEYGVGDVIVTYENELLARIAQGVKYDVVTPSRTILIENPAAVVDVNADKHGVREAADAFVAYLHGEKAQTIFAEHGFRPVKADVAAKYAADFPQPKELFDIGYLGGWDEVRQKLYSDRGVWYQVLAGQ